MKYKLQNYILAISLSVFGFFSTASGQSDPLIPCDGTPESPCGFPEVVKLIDGTILFILKYMVLPIAVIVICYGGFLYLTSGDSASNRAKANKMFTKLLIGLFFCLAAWVIVEIVLTTFGYDTTLFSTVITH